MKLAQLIASIDITATAGASGTAVDIKGVHSDSRKIGSGYLFVAVPGTQVDGHAYIDTAIGKGAVAIVCQILPESLHEGVGYIQVKDSADALGKIASTWYGEPSGQLTLVGVTGTNGKTTIATLLYEMFQGLGYKAGLLSTVTNYVDRKEVHATHTTPDPLELNALLQQMVEAGCEYAFMEVSSHAVSQKRISGLQFQGGIFTNLTRDHLDYHGTVEAYRDAKKGFFDQLPASAFALTNKDDKNGMFMLQNTVAEKKTYSLLSLADFKGFVLESHFDGMLLSVNGREVMTHFVGRFNAANLLAVYGATVLLGQDPEAVLLQMSMLHSVAGRFQTLRSPKGYTAIVDYAHTPDALVNVLNTIRDVLGNAGRVITVVGCGGNRDKGKRPIMAKESLRLSDILIMTSDNPRSEEPEEILNDMEAGLTNIPAAKLVLRNADRREAIRTACALAKPGDVILIAGKGHEDYQEIKGVKHHFDDREIVMELFETQKN